MGPYEVLESGARLRRPRRVVRLRRRRGRKAVAFAPAGRTAYWINGGPGAEFEPESQPAGTFALRADDAVAYQAVPRSWLPIPPPKQR